MQTSFGTNLESTSCSAECTSDGGWWKKNANYDYVDYAPVLCISRGGPCDSHATFSGGASFSEERVFHPFPLSRVCLLLDCRSKSCMRKSVVTLEHVPALCHVFYSNPLSFVTDVTKVLKRLKIWLHLCSHYASHTHTHKGTSMLATWEVVLVYVAMLTYCWQCGVWWGWNYIASTANILLNFSSDHKTSHREWLG